MCFRNFFQEFLKEERAMTFELCVFFLQFCFCRTLILAMRPLYAHRASSALKILEARPTRPIELLVDVKERETCSGRSKTLLPVRNLLLRQTESLEEFGSQRLWTALLVRTYKLAPPPLSLRIVGLSSPLCREGVVADYRKRPWYLYRHNPQ